MLEKLECLVEQLIVEVKELNNRVVSRTNSGLILEHDTATTKTYHMSDLIGEGSKANDLTILTLGGGFDISVNGEMAVTATLDYTIEDEDIFSITLKGTSVGTAVLRIGAYIPKYGRRG